MLRAVFPPFVHLTSASPDVNVADITSSYILQKLIIHPLTELVRINQTLHSIKTPVNSSISVGNGLIFEELYGRQ